MGKTIGIDLGTTNSCVAVMEGDSPKVVVNEEGNRTTPSVVGFGDDGSTLVGTVALRAAVVKPKETIYSVKRIIGSKYDEVAEAVNAMPYDVERSPTGDAQILVKGKKYSPPEISAKVLLKLKRAAEKYLGETVTDAVITVPAYFNDSQRQATKDAGKIAGLDVKRIINEPTAAAMAYGLSKTSDELIAVYDFGGGTFDVSVLEVSNDVIEVLSTSGDTRLGGDNIDELVIDFLVKEFKKDTGIDVSKDATARQRLKEAAEKAKKELSSAVETEVNLPFLTADATGPKHLTTKLSRAKFESMIDTLVKKTFSSCKQALEDAKKKPEDIDQVLLVGGSTRIPMVVEEVNKFFKKKPHQGVNPDEVVALGAAVQGGILSGDVHSMLLLDVTPLSLGIETLGRVTTVLIPRNTTVPVRKSEVFSTAENGQTAVDIHVLQGERQMAPDNRSLGKFQLTGLPPAPRGVPQVEVSFNIDVNGILSVSAKDKATGKEQQITITSASGLNSDEIDRMVREAKDNEDDDRLKKEMVEVRNKLDSLVYQTEKSLMEMDGKISAGDKSAVEGALSTAKAALESEDKSSIVDATTVLESALHGMAKTMYESAAAPDDHPDAASYNTDDADSDIIDAEFVSA